LISRALVGSTFWPWKKIFCVSIGCALLYAATDEYHQRFVAGRVGCLHDVLIDGAGAWIGMGVWP
jgi:VanZ family protein